MTPISKNIFIDKLHDIFNNVTVNIIAQLKMKPVDVKSNTYIDSSKEINDKDPKLDMGDIRIFCTRLHSKLVWRGFCD